MLTQLKNLFTTGYKNNPDAIIIACYFNPQRNIYRKIAFDKWFDTIKHLNYFILEGVLEGQSPEIHNHISKNGRKESIIMPQLLWHKETLLNKIINEIIDEGKYKYIFWLDTDVLFDNKNWLVDACKELNNYNVVQPFEWCCHLDRDEPIKSTEFLMKAVIGHHYAPDLSAKNFKFWRSFGANVSTDVKSAMNDDYDIHGHVGFAWGARTEYLKDIGGLYDKALIGGADHIMAHAFVGQIPCSCILKSFGDIQEIKDWSNNAFRKNGSTIMRGLSYVKGNLFHIWHGDTEKREYYKRIKEFTPLSENTIIRDERGFNQTTDANVTYYFDGYMNLREDTDPVNRYEQTGTTIEDLIGTNSNFEGGQFGGGGAGSDWEDNVTNDYPNFS